MSSEHIATAECTAIALLKEQVRACLLLEQSMHGIARKSYTRDKKPYRGKKSWPDSLKKSYLAKHTDLMAFAKKYGLCRKHIKQAVSEFKLELKNDQQPT